eukprot:m.15201 g.15201  ORF g.15201 m.15201 type:complete len:378 (+) comp10481_c0_seq1:1-1134(+)
MVLEPVLAMCGARRHGVGFLAFSLSLCAALCVVTLFFYSEPKSATTGTMKRWLTNMKGSKRPKKPTGVVNRLPNNLPSAKQPVPMWSYTDGAWKDATFNPSGSVLPKEITVISYNIWFDKRQQRERFDALMVLLEKNAAHVIALQEVCAPTALWIMENKFVQKNYHITCASVVTRENWYGQLTLVSNKLDATVSSSYYSFAGLDGSKRISVLGRGLLEVVIHGCNDKHASSSTSAIAVGNVHLESPIQGVTAATRAEQLAKCGLHLSDSADTFVLMGDFNFMSKYEDPAITSCAMEDVWAKLRPDDLGLTYDGPTNNNIQSSFQSRPDRIVCGGKTKSVGTFVQRLGVDVVPSIQTHVSDHYGLVANITLDDVSLTM